LPYFPNLKMEAVYSSKTLVNFWAHSITSKKTVKHKKVKVVTVLN
jgi:hypothetical protein